MTGRNLMELKPLFPDQCQIASISSGVKDAEDIIISLPAIVESTLHDQALSDLKIAFVFIHERSGNSSATFKAYRSAIERFFLFLWFKQNKTLKSFSKQDFMEFLEFSQHPDQEWVGVHARRFVDDLPNIEWFPYSVKPTKGKTQAETKLIYKTADNTVRSLMSRLSSFFSYLVSCEYILCNPVFQLSHNTKCKYVKRTRAPAVKHLSKRQMEFCMAVAEVMAQESPQFHERTRFIIHFMLSLYLRISEMVPGDRHTPMMKDFFRDNDGGWWFRVIGGKGNKDRLIAMSDTDVAALARYRISRNLHPYPSYNEDEPLITRIRGTGGVTSDRNIRNIVQRCFNRTKMELMHSGYDEDARTLHDATAHWLRHTGIFEDLNSNNRPLTHVAGDAGHLDLKTTNLYVDKDLRDRHKSKQNNKHSD